MPCTGKMRAPSTEVRHHATFTAEEFEGYERRMNSYQSRRNAPDNDSIGTLPNKNHAILQSLEFKHPTIDATALGTEKAKFNDNITLTSSTNISKSTLCKAQEEYPTSERNYKTKKAYPPKDKSVTSLPEKRQNRYVRTFRHTLWNVYRRLFSIVLVANIAALVPFLCLTSSIVTINLWHLATAASANILVGTTIRQDYIQIILYRSAWLVPQSTPLRIRRLVAKLYENGGVHSGCGVAGSMWFTALTVLLTIQFKRLVFTSVVVLVITYVLQVLFVTLLFFAYPSMRSKYHNTFEMTHRFIGWAVIILFWVDLGVLASVTSQKNGKSVARVLVEQPSFWFIIIITVHTILPWALLRRWEFEAENLSLHAVRLHFKQNVSPFTGIAISKSPLFEWHPFATMPSLSEESTGGSLIVSSAGDWTKKAVESPKTHYWVRGIPKPGVLGMSLIFRRVIVVTTGSGIGPCLSILASKYRKTQCRVLWSSPSPLGIFGREVVECVKRVDPDAMIIDTRKDGRPDMLLLTYRLYVEAEAEAVFVISNPSLTKKIVYGMESRGVPAFGPVWDS